MKRLILSPLMAIIFCTATNVSANLAQFQVSNGQIIDPSGEPFVVKGTNVFWETSHTAAMLRDCWNFNTIRLNHYPDPETPRDDLNSRFDETVALYADRGTVVIFDLAHDGEGDDVGIGHYWTSRQDELVELYAYYADRYRDNPYVWFDLINEPGTVDFDSTAWVELHQKLIRAIRNTGNNNPILVEGWAWGQDAGNWESTPVPEENSAILSLGDQILNFDDKTYQNIIFSHHVYDQWKYADVSRLADYVDRVRAKGYALVVGEYGSHNGSTDTLNATESMFEVAIPHGVGRIVWTWVAADNNDLTNNTQMLGGGDGIDSCTAPTNLTELGELIWADNHSAPPPPPNEFSTLTVTKTKGSGKVKAKQVGERWTFKCYSNCEEKSYDYSTGSNIILQATPKNGFEWLGWSGDCSGTEQEISVTLNSDMICMANFRGANKLTVQTLGDGKVISEFIDCGEICEAYYPNHKKVVLKAIPDAGYSFLEWDCEGKKRTRSKIRVKMKSDMSCTASFAEAVEFRLISLGEGSVKVTPTGTDCGINCNAYAPGKKLKLKAIPDAGSLFVAWGGNCTGTKKRTTVTMDSSKRCIVSFIAKNANDLEKVIQQMVLQFYETVPNFDGNALALEEAFQLGLPLIMALDMQYPIWPTSSFNEGYISGDYIASINIMPDHSVEIWFREDVMPPIRIYYDALGENDEFANLFRWDLSLW